MSTYHHCFTQPLRPEEFLQRKRYLTRLIGKLEKWLETAPEGSLVVNRKGTTSAPGFYHVMPGQKKRVYLNKSHEETIRKLAQKDYVKKALRIARKELAALEAVLVYCEIPKVEDAFDLCREDKRPYITPLIEPDEAFRHDR